jgi:hypothetical protein
VAKLLQLSLLIALVLIPARLAKERDAMVGLRKAIVQMLWFNLFYALFMLFIFSRLS